MIARISLTLILNLFLLAGLKAGGTLPREEIYTTFKQANDAFRQANSIVNDIDKANALYEKAVLGYEKIIRDGHVENPKLYYNLANAYLLRDDVGRAILNYLRAEKLDKSDSNIQKNLAFARSRRIDQVGVKTETRIRHTLAFWHYDFSMKTKLAISCVCFAVFCLAMTAVIWSGRNTTLTATMAIAVVLLICFAGSLAIEAYSQKTSLSGVIISPEVTAYQGDGQNYPPSFKAPLHAGTEFELIERRPGWFHIKLADGSDSWILQTTAEII